MKATHILFGTLISLLSASAMAQSAVKTDAAREKANLNAGNNYPVIKFESTRTRADVVAELEASRLGKPFKFEAAKPHTAGSPKQGKSFDASLYNGA